MTAATDPTPTPRPTPQDRGDPATTYAVPAQPAPALQKAARTISVKIAAVLAVVAFLVGLGIAMLVGHDAGHLIVERHVPQAVAPLAPAERAAR